MGADKARKMSREVFFLAFIQIHKEEEDKNAVLVDGRYYSRGILTA